MTEETDPPSVKELAVLHTFTDPAHADFSGVMRKLELGMHHAYFYKSGSGYREYETVLRDFVAKTPAGSPMYEAAILMKACAPEQTPSDFQIRQNVRAVKDLIGKMNLQGELATLIAHASTLLSAYADNPEEYEQQPRSPEQLVVTVKEIQSEIRGFLTTKDTARRNRKMGVKNVLRIASDNSSEGKK